ncbi:hypothetical protein ABZW02_26375 [Streptomyces sp. NPDC005180]|uniref:hypothetical protein n=1 Tax=Streptomyces sp. NPDC005180 TaxID=3156868 RepID=UPI0033BDFCCB
MTLSALATELAVAAETATRGLDKALPSADVVILGNLAAAHLQGGDVDQGIHIARESADAASARPNNTVGTARAHQIGDRLPAGERQLADQIRSLVT